MRRLVVRAAALGVGASLISTAQCESIPTGLGSKHPNSVVVYAGASQQEPKPSMTMEYWCLRALGELPRLILETTGTPYNSVFHFGGSNYKEVRFA